MSLFIEEHCNTEESTEYEVLDDDVTLTGTQENDVIISGSGHDVLMGEDGDDFLNGGNNDDILRGGRGNDSLAGNCDRDSLTGHQGNDVLDGGSGDDLLDGGAHDDTLHGGEGNDVFRFSVRYGNLGVDTILDFNPSQDRLQFVGFEFDNLSGGTFSQIENAEELPQQDAAIIYDASSGLVYYNPSGMAGDEEAIAQLEPGLSLSEDNIELVRSQVRNPSDNRTSASTLSTSENEFLDGTDANETIDGADGEDYIQGRKGDDVLLGGDGNDVLKGGMGDDTLYGGSGADHLKGRVGNDLLDGGLGEDTLSGGEGDDTFRFTFAPGEMGIDTITNFNATEDVIAFSGFAFDDTLTATFAQVNDAGDVSGQDAAIIYDTSSGLVYYNPTGDAGDEEAIAQLDPGLNLDDDNFELI